MMCPASCFPLLRGLPPWPCLLSWSQRGDGDAGVCPVTVTSAGDGDAGVCPVTLTSARVTEGTPPICPDTPPSRTKQCTQLGYVRSQRRCPDVVNTDQREASELPACTCPCSSSCRWQGILGDVVPHLIQAHRLITHREGKEVVFPLSNSSAAADAVDRVMLQSCFGRAFVLVVKKEPVVAGGPASFFATVLFVGASEEAEGFVYRLELRGDRRRLMWEATPRAIQGSLATGPTDLDCMMFEPSVASLFTASGTLGLHVSIYRSCSTTDPSPHTQELPPHRQLTGRANPASLTQGSPYLETMPSAQL